jgi:hypothetical protein
VIGDRPAGGAADQHPDPVARQAAGLWRALGLEFGGQREVDGRGHAGTSSAAA